MLANEKNELSDVKYPALCRMPLNIKHCHAGGEEKEKYDGWYNYLYNSYSSDSSSASGGSKTAD